MNITMALAAGLGLLLTIAGALGAHEIPPSSPDLKASWDTALVFGFAHVLAAMFARVLAANRPLARYAAWSFLIGVATFSFTILVATASRASSPVPADADGLAGVSVIAPVGGAAFMIGWALLVIASLRNSE